MSGFTMPGTQAIQLVAIPAGFAQAIDPFVKASGALDHIATGDEAIDDISYDDIDNVPKILGPLVDLDVEPKGPMLTEEEIMGEDLYAGLEGSGFEEQRTFLQDLAYRKLPPIDEFWKYREGLIQRKDWKSHEIALATISYLKYLAQYRSPYRNSFDFFPSAKRFSDASLFGAAAMMHDIKLRIQDTKNAESETVNRFITSNTFLNALQAEQDRRYLGAAYLYGLHYAKISGIWAAMQQLFAHAGAVHEAAGSTDAADKAYWASLWTFANKKKVSLQDRDMAVQALETIERLGVSKPLIEIVSLQSQLKDAEITEVPPSEVQLFNPMRWLLSWDTDTSDLNE